MSEMLQFMGAHPVVTVVLAIIIAGVLSEIIQALVRACKS